jgi:HEAT repeat protein
LAALAAACAAACLGRHCLAEVAAAPDVQAQIERLSSSDPKERAAAAETLAKIGKPAAPQLIAALDDDNEAIRARAAHILGRIGEPAAKEKLLSRMNDPSPAVRAQSACALGRIGGPDVLQPLLAAAKDQHALVRQHALTGLGFLRDARAVEPLLAMLADPNYDQQGSVCRALGAIKDKRAVEPLIAVMRGPRASAQPWYAAGALAEIGDKRAVEPLMGMLEYPHDFARMTAVRSLIQLGADYRVYTAITKVLKSQGLRSSVAQELAKAGDAALPALADALADDDAGMQAGAEEALRAIYGAEFDHGGREWFLWLRKYRDPTVLSGDFGSIQARPVEKDAERKLVQVAAFSVPQPYSVWRFVIAGDKLFAAVRYQAGIKPAESVGRQPDVTVPVIKDALAAWDLNGKMLWKTDLHPASQVVVAGSRIVVVHDIGNRQSGLIWIDAADGKRLGSIELPGRPGTLAFNTHAELLMMVLYTQERLASLEGGMEVRAYKMDGTLAWAHKEPVPELAGLCLEGRGIVVAGSSGAKEPFVAGLEPLSGKLLWRRRWGRFPAVPEAGAKVPDNLKGLACIPGSEGIEFVDPATGATGHALPRVKGQPWVPKFSNHTDRIYFTSTTLENFTLAAMAFPSGKLLWVDRTGTISYGSPTAWGENTAFLTRRLSEGLTGTVTVTELRIYSPQGVNLHTTVKERPSEMFNDVVSPQASGERLYLVEGSQIVALHWQ